MIIFGILKGKLLSTQDVNKRSSLRSQFCIKHREVIDNEKLKHLGYPGYLIVWQKCGQKFLQAMSKFQFVVNEMS